MGWPAGAVLNKLEPSVRPVAAEGAARPAAELVAAAAPRLREKPARLVCGAAAVRPVPKESPVAGVAAGAAAVAVVREKGAAEAAGFPKLKPVLGAATAAAVGAAAGAAAAGAAVRGAESGST